MADFLPSLGYLALRAESGILPAHIAGTYEALPKGQRHARAAASLRVRFGPFLSLDFLRALTEGLPQQEAWRLFAAVTQRIVEHLRDGKPVAARRGRRAGGLGRRAPGPAGRAGRRCGPAPRARRPAGAAPAQHAPARQATGGAGS